MSAATFSGRDDRGPYSAAFELIAHAFAIYGTPLLVDYEHRSLMASDISGPLPAAGCIAELQQRGVGAHRLDRVLHHEGGFVNDPGDPGGATNFGVSLRFLRQAGYLLDLDGDGDTDADDVRLMSREDAIRVYRERFWRRIYDLLHAS